MMQMVELQSSLGGQALYKFQARDIQKNGQKKSLSMEHKINITALSGCVYTRMLHCLELPRCVYPSRVFQVLPHPQFTPAALASPTESCNQKGREQASQASPDVNQAADDKQTISICAIDTKQKISSQIQQLRSKESLSTPGSPLQRPSHLRWPCSRDLALPCPQPPSRVTFGLGWDTDCQ